MPRKRTVSEIAQDESQAKPPAKKPPAKKRAPAAAKKRATRRTREPKRHPTVAETVKRNQQIVTMRDVEFLTWTQIAERLDISDKTARDGYKMYVDEIAPLLVNEDAVEKAQEFIRKLEGVQNRFATLAAESKNESIRMGALRNLVETMWREIELRQALGLMPKHLGELTVVAEIRWVAEQVISILKKYEAPKEAFEELHKIMSGGRSN